ncbi:hypothetical protein HWC59_gp48 [Proteus phage Myduc]|uniref:Uncharacterized protein n=1 Tax=Proteus phage Myduc TaxID=2650874 RepID=A0A5J6TDT9_9CAUD|nr:hypothetical protein HWC59_gp48 [Proteus phage Myduc]QFG06689.1 hypothetical protein CPT_Myduc_067 [Proteus phage Myduc]
MPFNRQVEVVITNKDDPSKKVIFKDHRIDFEVRSSIGFPADVANITIFNLSIDEVKFLQDRNFGNWYIEIFAGYVDNDVIKSKGSSIGVISTPNHTSTFGASPITESNSIFSGAITNCIGYRKQPEHVTKLFCISKSYIGSTEFKQMRPIPKGATLKEAIISMCQDYGFSTVTQFGMQAEDTAQILKSGRIFHNTFLEEFRKLLKEYNLNFTMTTNEIQIFPETFGRQDAIARMVQDREPIKLDTNQVIGNVLAGICVLRLDTFINASIQPGMILDVSPLMGTEILANGVVSMQEDITLNTDQSVFRWAMEDMYQILEVVHSGSTHQTTYKTSISAVIGGNTAMGLKEIQWQDMYASTGMGLEVW